MKRSASAMWNGDLKTGKGTISTDSGVLSNTQYSFSTRFEDGVGTNPEELIGAAHAGCFSMALSAQLGEAGLVAQSIRTKATVTLDKTGGGFEITAIHLDLTAKIPGASQQAFDTRRRVARCPRCFGQRSRWTRNSRRSEPPNRPLHSADGGVVSRFALSRASFSSRKPWSRSPSST